MPFRLIAALGLALALAGCQPLPPAPDAPPDLAAAPPGAPPGTCWGKEVEPAVIETVTEQVEIAPGQRDTAGTLIAPARYATETRQAIVRERVVRWIETPCPEILTADFVAALQRALAARGSFQGPVTGTLDARTRAAIGRHQAARGLDTDIFTLETARDLGLVAVPRES